VTDIDRKIESTDPATPHLVIVGPMGVGKTTIGTVVAQRLGWPFIDSDRVIETVHGRTGSDIVGVDGVARLHRIEVEVLDDALRLAPPSVIAAAASVADGPLLVDRMASARVLVVLLTCEAAELAKRAKRGGHRRHIEPDEVVRLIERRTKAIEPIAAAVIDVTGVPPQEVAGRIERLVRSQLG
jgi:shikimate kinase